MMSVIFSSCSGDNSLNVGFRNMGKENIFAFDSKIGKYNVGAGLLVHRATSSSHLFFKRSFEYPDTVIVKWRKSDENIIEKAVPLKGQIPKEFRTGKDEIIFNIFPDDTVKLSFVIQTGEYTWKEIDSEGKLVNYGNKK
jgi:hypothetical protein